MSRVRRALLRPHGLLSVLLVAAAAALVLQGASLPHMHLGAGPGLYNHDHDLTLLATLHGAAVLHDTQPAPLVLSVVTAVTPLGLRPPASAARTTADSRAPPRA